MLPYYWSQRLLATLPDTEHLALSRHSPEESMDNPALLNTDPAHYRIAPRRQKPLQAHQPIPWLICFHLDQSIHMLPG